MKHYKRLICISFSLILLLTSCSKTADIIPSNTPPAMSGPLVSATPSPTLDPTPSQDPTPEPTLSPIPTLTPDLTLPISIELVLFDFSDDDVRLYIKTQYPNPSLYETNSIGALMASNILADTRIYYNLIKSMSEEAPATSENLLSYGLTTMTEITNNDSEYLSVYVDYYSYSGGAHGNVERISYNYSSEGYRIADFSKILNTGITKADVEVEINKQITSIIKDMGPAFYEDVITFDTGHKLPPFYIKDGVLVIYYQTYDIAPYAYGIPMFEMPPEIFSIP